jgi:hypothetical protein
MANPKNEAAPPQDERMRSDSDRETPRRMVEMESERDVLDAQRETHRDMTDPERRRKLRERWGESILPNLPDRPGYHRCWVSTTHPIDTPQRRRRFGYQFVKMEDVRGAGWTADVDAVKDGSFSGCVMWRELVAMEITQEGYLEYMTEFHRDQPYEQGRNLIDGLDELADTARSKGGRVTLEESMEEFRQRIMTPPAKTFE